MDSKVQKEREIGEVKPANNHSHHHATTIQLGGKGTIRRRRLRKSNSLNSQHGAESLQNFLHRFQFQDCGKMDSVTFIYDNGTLATYDSVQVHGNLKNNF